MHCKVNPVAMSTFINQNSIGRLVGRKSLDRIIAPWSVTSIRGLLDPNLLIRSTHLSVGSHTNRLVRYGMGCKVVACMCILRFNVLYPLVFEIFIFYPHIFEILSYALMKFSCMPSCFRNFVFYPFLFLLLSFLAFFFLFCRRILHFLDMLICDNLRFFSFPV